MFGQLPGRSVFNTPTGLAMFVPFSVYYLKTSSVCLHNPLLAPLLPCVSPLFLWPRKPRCWPHAFWQSCTRGRLGALLSNDAYPIADNEAPRRHARF